MSRWRNLLGIIAVPVALLAAVPAVLLALPFLVVSTAVRGAGRLLGAEAYEWHELIRYDPEIGWRPEPGVDGHQVDMNGDAYRLRTGEDGWRGPAESIAAADVVVFGDSFAFGNAIDDHDFFGNLSEDPVIKAVGSPGYNMVQELLLMERYVDDLAGKSVVWLVYPGNDLDENLRPDMGRYRIPFVRQAGEAWEVVTEHLSREEWSFPRRGPNHERYVRICTPSTHLSRRAFSACEFLIRRGSEVCRSAGARLTVMLIPDLSEIIQEHIGYVLADSQRLREGYEEDLPGRRVGQACSDLGVDFVDLGDHLSPADYRSRDIHWNAGGHRKVAGILSRLHRHAEADRGKAGAGGSVAAGSTAGAPTRVG